MTGGAPKKASPSGNWFVRYLRWWAKRLPSRLSIKAIEALVSREDVFRFLITAGLIVGFALLQTTFLAVLRPFGGVPDVMLALTVALALTEGPLWGGASGIAAAFLIECLGATSPGILPLIYAAVGVAIGLARRYQLSDTLAVRGALILAGAIFRAALSLIYCAATMVDFPLSVVFAAVIGPEFLGTLFLAVLPHLAAYWALRWSHKARAERILNDQ